MSKRIRVVVGLYQRLDRAASDDPTRDTLSTIDDASKESMCGSEASLNPMDAVATQPSIEGALADIRAWNEVERRDNHECHTLKLLELCLLPTRGFALVPIEPLNTAQGAELDDDRVVREY